MKTVIITKKHLLLCLSTVLAVVAVCLVAFGSTATHDRRLPIYCVETDKKQIAISFDAAWGNEDTETLIGILKEYQVPATFFVVGSWVDKYPKSVKALADAGHQVQNHSNTHPYLSQLSESQICDEIESCNRKIETVTGVKPTLLRPPYGDYDNCVVETVQSLDMFPIQWSVDSLDWKDSATADSIYNRVVSKVKPGSIVLFHNAAKCTPQALPRILEALKKDGYEFVLISDLIYKEDYKIDNAGKQCQCEKE